MFERRSKKPPIILGVVMIVLLVALTVGWVLMTVFGATSDSPRAGLYWTMLTVGSAVFVFMVVGVSVYLGLSVKSINLSRRQSNFIDSVTHELKSPIASLKLYLQTLNRRSMSPDEQAVFYRTMLEDVERLDELINHLLAAARVEDHPADEVIEIVDLAELLTVCAKATCSRYPIETDQLLLDLDSCSVKGQQVDVDLIFRNLIDNAVKYGGDTPQVEVTLRNLGETAEVCIADNGPGIPRKHQRRIFGRFVRLGLELERKKPGTGLGLYIVRTLVKRLGGEVSVHDRQEGSGTLFVVTLPTVEGTTRNNGKEMSTLPRVESQESKV